MLSMKFSSSNYFSLLNEVVVGGVEAAIIITRGIVAIVIAGSLPIVVVNVLRVIATV